MIININDQHDGVGSFATNGSVINNYAMQRKRKKSLHENDINDDANINDEMGSAEHKNGIVYKSNKNKEQSSSLFVQINHSHAHNLQSLQMTAQKLRVKHVYAASARNVPNDSFGYICCKYIGNIGTAGNNMLFVDDVKISY